MRVPTIKILATTLFIICLQGCATAIVINMARHDTPFAPFEKCQKGSSWWYAATPITIPFDIALSLGLLIISNGRAGELIFADFMLTDLSNKSEDECPHTSGTDGSHAL